jgi:hypothetical protein
MSKCWWCGLTERDAGPLLPNGLCRVCNAAAEAMKKSA